MADTKWEYMQVKEKPGGQDGWDTEELNKLGALGWEVFQAHGTHVLLKRIVPPAVPSPVPFGTRPGRRGQ